MQYGWPTGGFCRPVQGEFTTLTGISTQIGFCLLLAVFVALPTAQAYSYDEIVMMVKAEDKAFGKSNFGSSMDQRLKDLELHVFGQEQSGSESHRLRKLSRELGLEKQAGASIADPYSIVVSPRSESKTPAETPDTSKQQVTNPTNAPGSSDQNNSDSASASVDRNTIDSTDSSLKNQAPKRKKLASSRSQEKAFTIKEPSRNQAETPLSNQNSQEPEKPMPASGENATDTQNPIPVNSENEQAAAKQNSSFASELMACMLGVVSIFMGLLIFFLLKGKEELSVSFKNRQFDPYNSHTYNQETYYDQSLPLEGLQQDQASPYAKPEYIESNNSYESFSTSEAVSNSAQSPDTPAVSQSDTIICQSETQLDSCESRLRQPSFEHLEDVDRVDHFDNFDHEDRVWLTPAFDESGALNFADQYPNDNLHVSDFALDWDTALNRSNLIDSFASNDSFAYNKLAYNEQISSLPRPGEAAPNRHESIKHNLQEQLDSVKLEFHNILDKMTSEELQDTLENFDVSENSEPAVYEELEHDLLGNDFPALLSLSVSDFLCKNTESDPVDPEPAEILREWPAFEPPVAPKIITVGSFLENCQNAAKIELPACLESLESLESFETLESFKSFLPEQIQESGVTGSLDSNQKGDGVIAIAENNIDQANKMNCDEWDGECYRALAQILIEAAMQVRIDPAPLAACIPVVESGRCTKVLQFAGRKNSVEYESLLRTLFSERIG